MEDETERDLLLPLLDHQQAQVNSHHIIDIHAAHEVSEREEGIRQIHSTMLGVHEIYRDIGILTREQQYMIGMYYFSIMVTNVKQVLFISR